MNATLVNNAAASPNPSVSPSVVKSTIGSSVRAPDSPRNFQTGTAEPSTEAQEEKALRETAQRFEALLVHTMLKSMRKTTLSESNSNERAVYDDMFDDRIATVVSQSGRLGVSDAIMRQLRPEGATPASTSNSDDPSRQIRQILQADRALSANNAAPSHSGRTPGDSLATLNAGSIGLERITVRSDHAYRAQGSSERRQQFLQPLMAYADISARRLGTSPQAVLAVAALETGWGQHRITDSQGEPSNNLFGIKAQSSDRRSATATTTEYIDGKPETVTDHFKVYEDPAASVEGFADFILENPRYATALQHASDPERFLVELQRAGYATDPRYAEKAISVMRRIETHTGVSG